MMVKMNDDDATAHFVRDISPKLEGGTWRWAQKRPAVRILLSQTTGLKFIVDLTVPNDTMKHTGPVTISYFIDDRPHGSVRYDKPGSQHFEQRVDPKWVQTVNETIASAEIDKMYDAPDDGKSYGFILVRMGFEPE
jgi:hypothetical protein